MLDHSLLVDAGVSQPRRVFWVSFCLLTLAVVIVFGYSLYLRLPYFALLPSEMKTSTVLIPITIQNVNDWIKETRAGAFQPVVYAFPRCVEFPNDVLRVREIGYFPLSTLIIYTLAGLLGRPPTIAMIEAVNLFYHFLAALFLSWAVFLCLLRVMRAPWAVLLALPATILAVLLPGPMLYYLYAYYADTLVLPFFGAVVLLEILSDRAETRNGGARWRLLQGVVLFLGVLAEWLFVPVVAALLVKRWLAGHWGSGMRRQFKSACVCALPVVLGLLVYVVYCILNQGLFELEYKFLQHSGVLRGSFKQYVNIFLRTTVPVALGPGAAGFVCFVLAASLGGILVLSLIRRKMPRALDDEHALLGALLLLTLPCFIHAGILREHYIENEYTPLKFVFPLAAGFSLLPALLGRLVLRGFARIGLSSRFRQAPGGASGWFWGCVAFSALACASLWLQGAPVKWESVAFTQSSTLDWANAIATQPVEGDVLFSPGTRNVSSALQYLPFAGRLVWPLSWKEGLIQSLLAGRSPFCADEVLGAVQHAPKWVARWGLCPDLPEESWKVPRKFTVGILLDAGEPVPPEAVAWMALAEKDLTLGRFRNLVISSDALRKLYPSIP